jgi:hypothetical protein
VKFWTSAAELPGLVALALRHTIKTYPALGWVRGDIQTAPELLRQLNDLRTENQEFQAELSVLRARTLPPILNLASGKDEFTLHGTYGPHRYAWEQSYSWDQIFMFLGPKMMIPVPKTTALSQFSEVIKLDCDFNSSVPVYFELSSYDFDTIIIQLKELGLIDTSTRDATLFCRITEEGLAYLTDLRVIRKPERRPINDIDDDIPF